MEYCYLLCVDQVSIPELRDHDLPYAHVVWLGVGDPDATHLVGVDHGDAGVIVTLRAGPGVLAGAALQALKIKDSQSESWIVSLKSHPVFIVR